MRKNDKKNTPSGNKEDFEHFAKILMGKMDSTVKTVTVSREIKGHEKRIKKIEEKVLV